MPIFPTVLGVIHIQMPFLTCTYATWIHQTVSFNWILCVQNMSIIILLALNDAKYNQVYKKE